jgi:hypothetical protein
MTDRPDLRAVPDLAGDADPGVDPGAAPAVSVDPLLEQAERIGGLPLGERPAALDRLNQALAAELNALEEV